MSNALDLIRTRAVALRKHIALADATDERMLRAGRQAVDAGLASISFVGDEAAIREAASRVGVSLDGLSIISTAVAPELDQLVDRYRTTPKGSELSLRDAWQEVTSNPLLFAALLARIGRVDGVVGGSLSTTGNVIRAALRGIGLQAGVTVLSSMFLMDFAPIPGYRDGMTLGFGDCAVIPEPTAEQLADIALATSSTYETLTGNNARVAMLSFSTKGSAKTSSTETVIAGLEIARNRSPQLIIDGELQFDAAFVPEVGLRKAPGSGVAGGANVFIFPNLDAGNIGYKIAERLGLGRAVGPILQGLQQPMNDLSRGAHVSDIVDMIAITAVQAS